MINSIKHNSFLKVALCAIVAVVFIVIGCSKELEQRDNFDRQVMLQNIADNVILPQHQVFESDVQNLQQAIEDFTLNPTTTTLISLQNSWENSAVSWELIPVWNIGEVADTYIQNKIEFRPSNTVFIESFIAGTDVLDNAYIETKGSSSKGLPAVEYLIFDATLDNSIVLDSFTTSALADRRKEYLFALGENLVNKSAALGQLWQPITGGYYDRFISSEGSELGSSISLIINSCIAKLERMYQQQLGKPLGKTDDNLAHPDLVESPLSKVSLYQLKQNLEAVYAAYAIAQTTDADGIDDYLDALGARHDEEALSDVVEEQFNITKAAFDAIPFPLDEAVVNDYTTVEEAYNELYLLLVYFEADVASQLSITITLNDNDGD